jgi:hypothetical protein
MFKFFRPKYPTLIFSQRDLIVINLSGSKKVLIRYELGCDVVFIYFGGITEWENSEKISEEDRYRIKLVVEKLCPKNWNIAWVSIPIVGI